MAGFHKLSMMGNRVVEITRDKLDRLMWYTKDSKLEWVIGNPN
jgi:hypothetical protein